MPEKLQVPLSKYDEKTVSLDVEKIPLTKQKESVPVIAPFSALFRYSKGSDYVLMGVGLAFTIGFSIMPLFLVLLIGNVIDSMSKIGVDMNTFYEEERDIAIAQFILGALTVFTGWLAVVAFIRLGNNVGIKWKSEYYRAVINRPIKWFDKHNPAEFGTSIDMDCDAIEHASGEKIMLLLSAVIFFLGSWILSAYFSLQLTLIALIMVPIQIAAAIGIEQASVKSIIITQEKYKTAGAIAEESLEGVKTIASVNAQDVIAKNYQRELEPLKRVQTLMGTLHGLGWSVFFVVLFAFCGAVFYYGSVFYDDKVENWTNGDVFEARIVIMIFFSCAMSSFYLGAAVPCLQYIQNGRVAAARVSRIISKNNKYDGYRRADNLKGEIEFKDVHFNYPSNRDNRILQGVTFKCEPGKSIAIVGETGSGKSTIIQLIEGFYYCQTGEVSIDGINIKDYDLSSLRDYIGLVSQEPILFNTSIKENIRMGRLAAFENDIADAATEAEANKFIDQLEHKYDTYVGLKGSQLSGGQKQRIAIARAMIKKPKILLLDEATSALDMRTEKKIQMTLDKVMKGRTTIIVAQRLSTIKNAERIIVLDQGKIIEQGTHNELLVADGAYARLQAIQAKVESTSIKSDKSLKSIEEIRAEIEEEEQKLIEQQDNGKMMGRIMSNMKNYGPWILLALCCSITTGLLFPVFGYLFADNLIIMLEKTGSDMTDATRTNMYYLFVEACIVLFTLTILSAALSRITSLYTYDIRYQGLKSLLYYDQKFFDKPSSNPATLSYRLASDCEKISSIGGPVLGLLSLVLAALAGGIIIATMHDIVLALVVLAMVPAIIVSNAKGEILQFEGLTHNDLKKTTAIASDSLTNIKTVHSYNRQGYFHQQYVTATEESNQHVAKTSHNSGIMFGLRYMVLYYVWGVIAWYGAYRVKEGDLAIDDMLIVFFCIMFSSWGFMVVGALIPDIDGGIESAKHMFAIIDYKPEINADSDIGSLNQIQGEIVFKNINFQYEGRSNVVLSNVNLKCNAGKTLGITGTTGSGKSTIAQLIMRFYDPTSGTIEIDGKNIRDFNLKHLRESICWVGQEPILFKGTLMFNMKIARADVTAQEVTDALMKAQGMNIISKYGLETDVGLRGSKLSGGEKQRVAIARALVRRPKVLVLDESTSALDPVTEANLQDKLKQEKFTIIAIAHRLKTIKDFDNIVLLEMGTVVEQGTHENLMSIPNGYYKRLYQTSD